MDVISFLFWEDECQQQMDRVIICWGTPVRSLGTTSKLNVVKRTDWRDRRWNHKIIEIEYKEEGQKSSEWHLGFWWGQLGEWWDIQERRQVLLERRLSLVLVVTLRCMWSYLEGFRVCNRSGLVDRGRRWNSGSVWRREVRGECGIFPFQTCLAEKMGEVGLSVWKCEGKR